MIANSYGGTWESVPGDSATNSSKIRSTTRRNHKIILDGTWAKLLNARKTAGVYQIGSSQLRLQLLSLQRVSGLNTVAATAESKTSTMTVDALTPWQRNCAIRKKITTPTQFTHTLVRSLNARSVNTD
jgi:hypothetical protein